jgi:acyl-CoA synthetase (AMP-forming)/AMP-acid ligase II
MLERDFVALGDVLRDGARADRDRIALIFEGSTRYSYGDLDRRSNQVANMLRAAGIGKGDRVAILAKNCVAYVDVLFGVAKLGAIFTLINWRLSPAEIGYILNDSGAAALFADQALAASIMPKDLDCVSLIVLDDSDSEQGYSHRLATASEEDPRVPVSRADIAMLVYTSGTTGHPKGAMLSHGSFIRHCGLDEPGVPNWVALAPHDVGLLVLPLFHIGSIEPLLRLLFTRATVVLHGEFNAARFLVDMQRHRATMLALVPTALQIVLNHPDSAAADFSHVTRFFYGASPIPLGLLQEALARLPCDFIQAYGMTETGGTCVMLAPQDHLDPTAPRLRAAGRPVLGAELKVVDAEGTVVGPGIVGEILVRGSGVMSGYWNRPEATAESLDAEGWLHSGDAGYIDEDGYVYIHDRIKDMICSGGENIYPAEVESAVYGHPDVAEVAVVGVPDSQWGESVKAVVVAKPGHEVDAADVIAWARGRIASYKAPKSVDVISELPKNAAGKILRRTIKARYWMHQDRMVN